MYLKVLLVNSLLWAYVHISVSYGHMFILVFSFTIHMTWSFMEKNVHHANCFRSGGCRYNIAEDKEFLESRNVLWS